MVLASSISKTYLLPRLGRCEFKSCFEFIPTRPAATFSANWLCISPWKLRKPCPGGGAFGFGFCSLDGFPLVQRRKYSPIIASPSIVVVELHLASFNLAGVLYTLGTPVISTLAISYCTRGLDIHHPVATVEHRGSAASGRQPDATIRTPRSFANQIRCENAQWYTSTRGTAHLAHQSINTNKSMKSRPFSK